MGILDKIFGTSSSQQQDDKYLFYFWAMFETAHADGSLDDSEGKKLVDYFQNHIGMSESRFLRLQERYNEQVDQFSIIEKAKNLTDEDKVELLNMLCGIALADGHFHAFEATRIAAIAMSMGLSMATVLEDIISKFEIDPDELAEATKIFSNKLNELKDQS